MLGRLPRKFGHCIVERRLGHGATSIVYLARHDSLGLPVAVKVLRRKLASERPEFAERFLREARTAARLEHPNLVRVIDCGTEAGYHYMTMDYVDGPSAMELLKASPGALDWREAVHIVHEAASGLNYAAGKGVIHRDVKPSNLMMDKSGRVRVTDLGLAKMTLEGMAELTQEMHTVGTPNYISPEQIRAPSETDLRADIYSLGATLYHLVTGRPPFRGKNPMSVLSQHMTEKPPPPYQVRPGLPGDLCSVIAKIMAKDPADRYQDYETLQAELTNLLEERSVAAAGFEDDRPSSEETWEFVQVLQGLQFADSADDDGAAASAGSSSEPHTSPRGSSDVELFGADAMSAYTDPIEARESTLMARRAEERAAQARWIIVTLAAVGTLAVLGLLIYTIITLS